MKDVIGRRGFLGALAAGVAGLAAADGRRGPDVKVTPYFDGGWTVYCFGNRGYGQMLSTLFLSPSGKVVMVDGGDIADGEFLHSTLMKLGGVVDTWFITHAHSDHYRALGEILGKPAMGGLKIGRLVYDFPAEEHFAKWEPACIERLRAFLQGVERNRLKVEKPKKGWTCDFGEGLTFRALNEPDVRIEHNFVNNTSICYRVENGGRTLLVTGDIGEEMANWILHWNRPEDVKSDICFMSHHGQSGAHRAFYEAVKPEICIWPVPRHVWENDPAGDGPGSGGWKTNYVKCWMQDLGVRRHFVLCFGDAALGPKPQTPA